MNLFLELKLMETLFCQKTTKRFGPQTQVLLTIQISTAGMVV